MMWKSIDSTVLSNMAKSGGEETLEAVVAALETKLTPTEV